MSIDEFLYNLQTQPMEPVSFPRAFTLDQRGNLILTDWMDRWFQIRIGFLRVVLDDIQLQFLLRQAFADDEASTKLLQILLFLLLSTASLMFIHCAVRSSFTLSIHFFDCLPLLLVPSTCPYSATTGSLFPSILVTCPNHVSLLFLILSTNVTCCPSSFLVTSFRILSLLAFPSLCIVFSLTLNPAITRL